MPYDTSVPCRAGRVKILFRVNRPLCMALLSFFRPGRHGQGGEAADGPLHRPGHQRDGPGRRRKRILKHSFCMSAWMIWCIFCRSPKCRKAKCSIITDCPNLILGTWWCWELSGRVTWIWYCNILSHFVFGQKCWPGSCSSGRLRFYVVIILSFWKVIKVEKFASFGLEPDGI
jgi:hypothetical protein